MKNVKLARLFEAMIAKYFKAIVELHFNPIA